MVKAAVISRTRTSIASLPQVPSQERAVVEVKVAREADIGAAGATAASPGRARVARAEVMTTMITMVMGTAIRRHPTAGNLARAVLATGANLRSQKEEGKVARAMTVMDTAILRPPTVGNLASQLEEAMDTAIQAGVSQPSQVATEEQEEASLASQRVRQRSMAIRTTTDITMDLCANYPVSSS